MKRNNIYIITDGDFYIGFDKVSRKDIIVNNLEQSSKLRYYKARRVLNYLPSKIKQYDWNIVNIIEAEEDFSSVVNFDLNTILDSLEFDTELLRKRKRFLEIQYLKIERTITDLYHLMEFQNLNVVEGFQLYKMMQEQLIKRRINKDEVKKINYLLSSGIGFITQETLRKIKRLDNRVYQPRVLPELFLSSRK